MKLNGRVTLIGHGLCLGAPLFNLGTPTFKLAREFKIATLDVGVPDFPTLCVLYKLVGRAHRGWAL